MKERDREKKYIKREEDEKEVFNVPDNYLHKTMDYRYLNLI